MKYAFAALLALLAASASADEALATYGGNTVVITDEPCELKVPHAEHLSAARATVRGVDIKACWASDGKTIHLIYEDGDRGRLPNTLFKPRVAV